MTAYQMSTKRWKGAYSGIRGHKDERRGSLEPHELGSSVVRNQGGILHPNALSLRGSPNPLPGLALPRHHVYCLKSEALHAENAQAKRATPIHTSMPNKHKNKNKHKKQKTNFESRNGNARAVEDSCSRPSHEGAAFSLALACMCTRDACACALEVSPGLDGHYSVGGPYRFCDSQMHCFMIVPASRVHACMASACATRDCVHARACMFICLPLIV